MKFMIWLFSAVLMFSVGASLAPVSAQATTDADFVERTLQHDGRTRRYLLYVPSRYDGTQAVPLVFVLHGGGGNPEIYADKINFQAQADAHNFILVLPAGTGRLRGLLTWNGGHCCGYAMEENVDDVGFFRAMVGELTTEFNIDPARIYTTGHSNGAIMSYRLAAEMSDVFAAAGIVAGTIGGLSTPESTESFIIPEPENPVSILHIHGMEDEQIRYEGGLNGESAVARRVDLSVAESIAFWVEANACETEPTHEERDNGMVLIDTYDCPQTGTTVELISIVDGGHSWPGGESLMRRIDPPSQRVDATAEIWAFFAAHPKVSDS